MNKDIHPYRPVEIEPVYRSLMCLTCGQRGRKPGDLHGCDHCGEQMLPAETNSSETVDGWYHGGCLVDMGVTFEMERHAIDVTNPNNWANRLFTARAGAAIQRERGDMDA